MNGKKAKQLRKAAREVRRRLIAQAKEQRLLPLVGPPPSISQIIRRMKHASGVQ